MRAGDDLEVRLFRPGDEQASLDLFNRVFSVDPHTGEPRSMGHWRWRFLDNPVGAVHYALAFNAEGEAVAQFGGIPVRTAIRGERRTCVQLADHMVDPRYRRGLKRQGIFAKTAMEMAKTYGGSGPDEDSIFFGYPVPANWRIGQRVLRYRFVRLMNFLIWSVPPKRDWAVRSDIELRNVTRFGEEVEDLWAAWRDRLTVATERTSAYLNWRFADCPDTHYELIEARDARGDLRGFIVLRAGGLHDDTAMLMEWLSHPRDDATRLALLEEACRFVDRTEGVHRLATWYPESCPEFAWLHSLGFLIEASPRILSARCYDPTITIDLLRRSWYMTPGDIDFL
ncbi:MAG: GNAT family N-acetyltransferase [Planctomycetota bacterium]